MPASLPESVLDESEDRLPQTHDGLWWGPLTRKAPHPDPLPHAGEGAGGESGAACQCVRSLAVLMREAREAAMNLSRSPSRTPWVSEVSTSVRRSFTS